MAPKFVVPYRMSGKRGNNDAADAAAICEAVQRPNMRFAPVKTELAQARLAVHTVRQGLVAGRTATINRLRGVFSEFGQVSGHCGEERPHGLGDAGQGRGVQARLTSSDRSIRPSANPGSPLN